MDLTEEFYRDEVRYGFYVPTAIKQAWGAELMILAEIDRICEKYGIRYMAEWGTLLGAVRHGGFVPWDDDMDIAMRRSDYDRFRQAAAKELPEGFAIHDYATKENHRLFLSRVVNRNQICFEEEHLRKYHNFPYIATVDVFVLDYVYRDERKEQARRDEIKYILALADNILDRRRPVCEYREMLRQLSQKYHVSIPGCGDFCPADIPEADISSADAAHSIGVSLYRLAEAQMARVPESEADTMVQMFPWGLKGSAGLPKHCYDSFIRLPFEQTTIPVPADYDAVVRARYGDYMQIHKVWGGHDYPYFEGQRKNLQAVADFPLPEFRFRPEMLVRTPRDDSQSLIAIGREYLRAMDELLQTGELLTALPELQQLAVDFAILTEQVRGEDQPHVRIFTAAVQQFCDSLYDVYVCLQEADADRQDRTVDAAPVTMRTENPRLSEVTARMQTAYRAMKETAETEVFARRTVLFVTTGKTRWEAMRRLCEEACSNPQNDVFVTEVPVAFKDIAGRAEFHNGQTDKTRNRQTGFDDRIQAPRFVSWQEINPVLLAPDVCYIQDPYDEQNPCLTIPPVFYAANLRRYTERLIFVPAFYVREFGPADTTDQYNLRHYVSAPAIMYADMVLVQSENMRAQYLKELVRFAGADTSEVWEKKLIVCGWPIKSASDADAYAQKHCRTDSAWKSDGKKRMLWCIGENEMSALGEEFLSFVKSRLAIFEKESEKLNVRIVLYPPKRKLWEAVSVSGTEKLYDCLTEFAGQAWCEFQTDDRTAQESSAGLAEICDAYYGAPSPYVHEFTLREKPVMLADERIR